jgi:hypothetical protein
MLKRWRNELYPSAPLTPTSSHPGEVAAGIARGSTSFIGKPCIKVTLLISDEVRAPGFMICVTPLPYTGYYSGMKKVPT